MQWADRMNQAIDYIEANLAEQIDPEEISRRGL